MYKYACLFNLNSEKDLKKDLEKYLSNKYIENKSNSYILAQEIELEKYHNTVSINKINTSEIVVYPLELVFIIFFNRVKDLKEYDFLLSYKPIILSDNQFVSRIFESKLSNNLTMISMELDKRYGQESINLIGNTIHNVDFFKDFDVFDYNSGWNIKEYAFQPTYSKYSLKIKSPNRVEFNKKLDEDEIKKIIKDILNIIVRNNKDAEERK